MKINFPELKTIIIGAGGLGREVAATIQNYLNDHFELLGFVDDGVEAGKLINDIAVLGGVEWLQQQEGELAIVFGIGSPRVKKTIFEKLESRSFLFPTIIHPNARIHDRQFVKMGRGNIISDGTIITTNVSLGDFNLINLSCTIGHDAAIGDFCSIMPGVNISGGAELKSLVYVGTGAKLIKATTLHDSCTVGAGSVVNTDIEAGKTYVGVPAKELKG